MPVRKCQNLLYARSNRTKPSMAHNFIIHFLIRGFLSIELLYYEISTIQFIYIYCRTNICVINRNTQFSWSNLFAFIDIGCEIVDENILLNYLTVLWQNFMYNICWRYLMAMITKAEPCHNDEAEQMTTMTVIFVGDNDVAGLTMMIVFGSRGQK